MERTTIVVFLMLVVAEGLTQEISDADRCCTPAQYQTKLGIKVRSGGHHRSDDTDSNDDDAEQTIFVPRFASDFTGKRVAMEEVVLGKRPANVTTIIDYNAHVAYVVLFGGKKCFKMPVKEPMEGRCLDQWGKAKKVATLKLGYEKNSLKVDKWLTSAKKETRRGPVIVDEDLLMTTSGCVPVMSQVQVKSRDRRSNMELLFWDFVSGIPDPSVFDVPAVCQKALELDPDDIPGFGLDLLGRFSAN